MSQSPPPPLPSSNTPQWRNEEVRQFVDGMYHGPDRTRAVRASATVASMKRLCHDISHDSILEIGCGEGGVLQSMADAQFGRRLYGIEISSTGVAATNQRNIPGFVEARLYDGYHIPYPDKSFDLATICGVLELVEHPRELLQRAAASAKYVYLMTMSQDRFNRPWDYRMYDGFVNYYHPRSLRWLVQSTQLQIVRQETFYLSRQAASGLYGVKGALTWGIKTAALKLAPRLAPGFFSCQTAILFTQP